MANHVVKRAAYNRRWVGGDAGGIVPHEACCIRSEATRAPLEGRRSCLRRAQARRARLIRQVYEVDPLLCSRCGGTMKVIAVIEPACADTADRRPAVIRQIRSAELATKPRSPGSPQRSAASPRATRPTRCLGRSAAARVVLRTAL
jgi:hypothetical protein